MNNYLIGCDSLFCILHPNRSEGEYKVCECATPYKMRKIISVYQSELAMLHKELIAVKTSLTAMKREGEESDDYDGANFLV